MFSDLYDKYKSLVSELPELAYNNKDVKRAVEIAEEVKRDKKKRNALAKETMAGRRINKLLNALHGQWHIIDLHDYITREFLVNNTQEFFDSLINGINWPKATNDLPYKQLSSSGSTYQYILKINEENEEGSGGEEEEVIETSSLPRITISVDKEDEMDIDEGDKTDEENATDKAA